jgi:2,3-bisphosphoglycerate-independent phosphoglycerate mutase
MNLKPTLLVILDGFGYNKNSSNNAIALAKTHTIMRWFTEYPSALLAASGSSVGLLPHMIGNSEVGHLTIGSGRIIKQPVVLITEALQNGTYKHDPIFIQQFHELKNKHTTIHFIGLLSDAGVHSLSQHLFGLLKLVAQQGITKIVVHPFLDGRDVPPQSAALYLAQLDAVLQEIGCGTIASLHGRFYAMDRDNNWERTKNSYTVLTQPQDHYFNNWQEALVYWYSQEVTDEFVPPCALRPGYTIKPEDSLLFFNFREDRARQLTKLFLDGINPAWFVTGVHYAPDLITDVLCLKPQVHNTFTDVLETAHKSIFSIAETEKYAHITYFFNGGREVLHKNETRILIPSLSSHFTYKDYPAMSAAQITSTIIESLETNPQSVYIVNYANADMVGHSGDLQATCRAIDYLNNLLEKLYKVAIETYNSTLYITADHGKAEDMWDDKAQQPRTAHTTNKVPFIMIQKSLKDNHYPLPLTELSDIAPFILKNLHLPIPKAMLKTK